MKSQLLQSLFDGETRRPLTVSEVNSQVKAALEKSFASVWLEGEIVNFVAANSGHWYFSLHDGDSQLKAACYRGSNWKIRFQPFDGLQVRVRGKLSVYEPKGEYQILVESLEPIGEGALKVAFEQIKLKLGKERLFDEDLKRPLPFFPRRVGVVTSPNGAAFHDILNVLSRRTKSVSLVLVPTRVQGEMAGEEIRQAILLANEFNKKAPAAEKIDVLIVGRGGGSAEDLWAFNEERLARTIRASEIPIISAVGHEIDWTIADLVADRRAPTPSAAAEIVAESEYQIEAFVAQRTQDLFQLVDYKLLQSRADLQELALSPVFTQFPQKIKDWRYETEDFAAQIGDALKAKLRQAENRFESVKSRLAPIKLASQLNDKKTRLAVLRERQIAAARKLIDRKGENLKIEVASLDALSPLAVLARGYSITENESRKIISSVSQIKQNEHVQIRLSDGKLKARVIETEKD
ncbi:MAG TPA: exodeoxyribonuclease VII large subunit [Pyrinomonadaceae bacterium]|jgi:exodeoxyribonuclease VII large subunit